MSRRVYLRAAALVIAAAAAIAVLTVYFSTQKTPPCLVTGVPKWHPPADNALHRFELVVPDRAICFFDMDNSNALIGYLQPKDVVGITAIEPRGASLALRYEGGRGALVDLRTGHVSYGVEPPPVPSDTIVVADVVRHVRYVTRRSVFGVDVVGATRRTKLTIPGYTWNPRFGPNPPNHGLVLSPTKRELWVLDAPNNVVHVFDLSGTPRLVKSIRLTEPLIGREEPCASTRCARIGSLQASADGRFLYVGDSGDVIDMNKREQLLNLEALHQSRLTLEVDWADGSRSFRRRASLSTWHAAIFRPHCRRTCVPSASSSRKRFVCTSERSGRCCRSDCRSQSSTRSPRVAATGYRSACSRHRFRS